MNVPIWFILSTYFLGLTFLYLGYRIWAKKQISLLGNIGKLKKETDLHTVCKLTSVYSFMLGASIMVIPLINLLLDFRAVITFVGFTIVGSGIFWFTLQKIYFTPVIENHS